MQTIHLDFQSQGVPPVVPVMQSDSRSRFLGIVLYDGGVPYQAPTGATYTVQYRSVDANTFGWYDSIIDGAGTHKAIVLDTASPHILTVELAEQALRIPGDVLVILCVQTDGGYQLSTFPIIVRVTGAACPDATQNNSNGSGLTDKEKALMLSLFENAAYATSGMQATYSALKTIWDSNGTVDPTPDTPTVIPVTSVTLNKSALTLTEGDSETLTATVLPSNATNTVVSWTVSPSGYATVSAGKVTAVAAGSCTVTATAGGKSASCTVTVKAASVANTNPFPDIKAAYMLPTSKTFSSSSSDFINTGLKLFESIDPKPTYTILCDFQMNTSADISKAPVLFDCSTEDDSSFYGINVAMWSSKRVGVTVFGTSNTFNTTDSVSERHRIAIALNGDQRKGYIDGSTPWGGFGTIASYTKATDAILKVGCDQDNARGWDGSIYQFVVYNSVLSDSEITSWTKAVP